MRPKLDIPFCHPDSIRLDFNDFKCELFVNGRWIFVGEILQEPIEDKSFSVIIHLPDINEFMFAKDSENNNFNAWYLWGPRLN